jgi:uncharacterized protein (TIGR03435 family)
LRLRTLLADRFKLAMHRETREIPVYALAVAKGGPKIKPEDPGGENMSSSRGHLTAKTASMATFADFLAGPYVSLGRPVVDKTGLSGVYSYTLDWTPESSNSSGRAPERTEGRKTASAEPARDQWPSIFTAVQEQLGLRLDARKEPLDLLVIDHAEKVPTEN